MITERIGFSLARFLTTKQSQSKEAGHQLETTTYAVVAFVLVFIRGQRTQGSAVVTGCWCSLSFDMYPIFSPDPSEAPHIATHRQMLYFPMCILGAEISASLREPRLIWRIVYLATKWSQTKQPIRTVVADCSSFIWYARPSCIVTNRWLISLFAYWEQRFLPH